VKKKNTALQNIESTLEYKFKSLELLEESLVHKSYAHEKNSARVKHNERLEFLGDAVLELVISDLLMKRFPDYNEGELSRHRASIVNEGELAKIALSLKLGKLIFLGRGEELTQGRTKNSILANTYEALLAALYLDGGYQAVYRIVRRHFQQLIETAAQEGFDRDFKTRLQEESQARFKEIPKYTITQENGPDHQKTFQVKVSIRKKIMGFGSGKSKKEADQDAARNALRILKESEQL